jgi:RNA polymerase sigma-70 factor (ECF subfamily)
MDGHGPAENGTVESASSLTERFETQRGHLQSVAYRMLSSLSEAEDAVQETWLRLQRANADEVANLGGWLTTVVSRICLDMLRSRAARREELVGARMPDVGPSAGSASQRDPEQEAVLADSVGRALLVVLDRLGPGERIAFVLHDMFAVPFDEIAPIVDRTPTAAKKLASRARQRVRGNPAVSGAELTRHRRVVEAFLAAARAGDLTAILAILAPDVVRTADAAAVADGRPLQVRGAQDVSKEIAVFGRSSRFAQMALVDGAVGVVVAPQGRLRLVMAITIDGERISAYELVADPARLQKLELAVLGEGD